MPDPTYKIPMDTALAEIEAMARELRRQIIPVDLWGGRPGYDLNPDRARYALYSLRCILATIKETK